MLKSKRYICIFLAFLLSLSLFGCGREVKSADSFLMKKSEESIKVSSEKTNSDIFFDSEKKENLQEISTTDMLSLYFNENKGSISVYDSGAEKLWRSLPEKYRNEKTGILSVTVLVGGNEYELFSSCDSENTFEITEKGIRITCAFSSATENGTKIGYTIPVEFRDDDGILTAQIDCNGIVNTEKNKNVVLKSINLLPFFGAFSKGTSGDGLVIPDGCGAFIDAATLSDKSFSVIIYGSDPSQNEPEEAFSVLPVFGIRHGSGAIAAVITAGDEIASVKARTASDKDGFNRIYPCFEITPTEKNEEGSYYVSENRYKGKISVSYRFLSKDSADYIGIAGACRELLIRNSCLTTENIDQSSEYPFNLSLIGSAPVADSEGKTKLQVLTDYSQCLDILESLKAKDINSVNLRYKGILDGGTAQKDISSVSLSESMGSKSDLKALTDYALKTDVSVFTDISLFSAQANTGFDDYALCLSSQSTVSIRNVFVGTAFELCSAKSIPEKAKSLLSEIRGNSFEGVCLSDAANVLYSDFSSGEVMLRNDIAESISSQMGAVSAAKKLMVERGNLYGIKYAQLIVDLPSKAFYKSKNVTEIPFVQAVLHGISDYSHSAVNTAKSSTDALLKCAEYGAVPYYEWYGSDFGAEENPDSYYYMNSVTEAQNAYTRMKNSFSDLRSERITDHKKVKKNVYMTEFGGSTKIYVNYGTKPVTVSGVTVEGKSFIRVN